VALNWYTVKRGESLATIARKLKVSRVDLAQANHLTTKSKVRTGQSLVIPRAPATLLATGLKPAPPAQVASRGVATFATVPDPETPQRTTRAVTHRVKSGDTLFGIARLYNTTVEKIKSWNHLRTNRITPGDRLKILAVR
jgi:membrane-bound lytic murein transglycosylase D